MITYTAPQYTRDEVNFDTWYGAWHKHLAATHTEAELFAMLGGASADGARSSAQHLRAIDKTHSMGGNSAARAHARNVTAAAGDTALAICAAIEIHRLFPERAKVRA